MVILHDPACAEYGSFMRPEQPARVTKTVPHLQALHPAWTWRVPHAADEATLRLAHDESLLLRLHQPVDFDDDTPWFEGIAGHARAACGAALEAVELARTGEKAFALMRPPGHHATRDRAMGFCYLNQVAVAALAARRQGVGHVAVWDFDAHHGNGTEEILNGVEGTFYVSVHQHPGYPGTGRTSHDFARNFPVAPRMPREDLLEVLLRSWNAVLAFHPDLVIVSAGFDAYARDPITHLTLEPSDFGSLGRWLHESGLPVAAVLEGGYSPDLPILIDAFLSAWAG